MTGTFREKDRQINFDIEELEKIKAELIGICNHCNCVSCIFVSLEDEKCLMKTIINNHISELKGSD